MEMPPKPRCRGHVHQWSFFVALAGAIMLVAVADAPGARAAVAIYGATLCGLLGTSALYHRVTWRPGPRRWLRRLDHSMIYLLIAGTYTPFAVVVFDERLGTALLVVAWAGAAIGLMLSLAWIDSPKWVSALVYVALGWVSVVAVPQILDRAGPGTFTLVLAGGVLYTIGAVIYAIRRPDPWPATFGYHECFHVLVVAAAACHFAAVAIAT
jgi:hemolysin III